MVKPDFIIVGCGGKKALDPSPIEELYRGSYVRSAVDWAQSVSMGEGCRFILSGGLGLVPFGEIVEPYEAPLNDAQRNPNSDFRQLPPITVHQVREQLARFKIRGRVLLIAGAHYRSLLTSASGGRIEIWQPFTDLSHYRNNARMGYQMQLMKRFAGKFPPYLPDLKRAS